MILEGLLTTTNADGSLHVAPMGPLVDPGCHELILRPFQSSTTFGNLARTGQGVFHVTDNVEMLAQAAVGQLDPLPSATHANSMDGWILDDACRWYAFRVESSDTSSARAKFVARVIDRGTQREFFGFNRGKHAVLEAAILATRVGILPGAEIIEQLGRLESWVAKTGGPRERRAFDFLTNYIRQSLAAASTSAEVRH